MKVKNQRDKTRLLPAGGSSLTLFDLNHDAFMALKQYLDSAKLLWRETPSKEVKQVAPYLEKKGFSHSFKVLIYSLNLWG